MGERLTAAIKNFTTVAILGGGVRVIALGGLLPPLTPQKGAHSLGAMWAIPAISSHPVLKIRLVGGAIGRWVDLTWGALAPLGARLGPLFGGRTLSNRRGSVNFLGAPLLALRVFLLVNIY